MVGVAHPDLHASRTHIWLSPDFVPLAEAIYVLHRLQDRGVSYADVTTQQIRALRRGLYRPGAMRWQWKRFLQRNPLVVAVKWDGLFISHQGYASDSEIARMETLLKAVAQPPMSFPVSAFEDPSDGGWTEESFDNF
jgi:hypothetical protein